MIYAAFYRYEVELYIDVFNDTLNIVCSLEIHKRTSSLESLMIQKFFIMQTTSI
jgi:hypothetical protein